MATSIYGPKCRTCGRHKIWGHHFTCPKGSRKDWEAGMGYGPGEKPSWKKLGNSKGRNK